MKAVKAFVKTCYSEALVPTESSVGDNEREDGSLISEEKDGSPPRESTYHGGLGLKFKFPGDPKKWVFTLLVTNGGSNIIYRLREASKIKLWTTYLRSKLLRSRLFSF
jgi:hypothetical protein